MKETKLKKIMRALLEGAAITSLSAYEIARTTRLSAIIYDLRDKGIPIFTGSPMDAREDGLIDDRTMRAMMLSHDNSRFAVYYIKPELLSSVCERWQEA